MAVNKIEINTDVLGADIAKMDDELALLLTKVDELYQEVLDLNRMWKGQANMAFNQQFQKDRQDMSGLLKELQGYTESLKNAGRTYVQCENSVGDVVRSLRI